MLSQHLPEKIEGYYGLNGYDGHGAIVTLARIEATGGVWHCVPNSRFSLLSEEKEQTDFLCLEKDTQLCFKDRETGEVIRFYVSSVEGQGQLNKFVLPENDALLIGSSENESDICYVHEAVSARHCKLYRQNGQWYVEDLGSELGTFLNKKPVERQAIKQGDVINVFEMQVVFLGTHISVNHPSGMNIVSKALKPFHSVRPTEHFDPQMYISEPLHGSSADHASRISMYRCK